MFKRLIFIFFWAHGPVPGPWAQGRAWTMGRAWAPPGDYWTRARALTVGICFRSQTDFFIKSLTNFSWRQCHIWLISAGSYAQHWASSTGDLGRGIFVNIGVHIMAMQIFVGLDYRFGLYEAIMHLKLIVICSKNNHNIYALRRAY